MLQKEFLYLHQHILYNPKFKLAFVKLIELSLPFFFFFLIYKDCFKPLSFILTMLRIIL